MLSVLLLLFLVFRWYILERFIGTIRMFLFDAIMFTILAASNIGNPEPWPAFSYAMAVLCIFFAINSARKYIKYDELQRIENEQRKSDS